MDAPSVFSRHVSKSRYDTGRTSHSPFEDEDGEEDVVTVGRNEEDAPEVSKVVKEEEVSLDC